MKPPNNAEYLGDGAYVSFDGWQFIVWGERERGWHYVVLEPNSLAVLNSYAQRIMRGEIK